MDVGKGDTYSMIIWIQTDGFTIGNISVEFFQNIETCIVCDPTELVLKIHQGTISYFWDAC